MSLKQTFQEVDQGEPGDYTFAEGDTYILIRLLPTTTTDYDGGLAYLSIKPSLHPQPVWHWDGNRETPTLTPSILHHPHDGRPDWHGYLTAGKLVEA